jgi:DNA mismatch endonuclease (patch repair protein)
MTPSMNRLGHEMTSVRSRAPSASSEAVRRAMRAVPSHDTAPERALRKLLHAKGLRFRKHVRPEPEFRCEADVVFPRAKVCVFLDGCFWHGCAEHFNPPKTNTKWWIEKISQNIRRDLEKTKYLRDSGWTVLRFWEHTKSYPGLEVVAEQIAQAVHLRLYEASCETAITRHSAESRIERTASAFTPSPAPRPHTASAPS